MNEILISLSILGYEYHLDKSIENIRKILSTGIKYLHIDVMRDPFIYGKNTFPEELISRLYYEFADEANFDFHLMTSNPDSEIKTIDKIILDADKRKDTIITIHREAYRTGLGMYDSKEYDLLKSTGDPSLDKHLKAANIKSGELVYKTLQTIKEGGYKAGLALEPGTSLDNISEKMIDIVNIILLMSVSSGVGGQEYRHEVTNKIREARQRHRKLMIQVDGGINEETLSDVIKVGANNIVIGSCITNDKNPTDTTTRIKTYIERR